MFIIYNFLLLSGKCQETTLGWLFIRQHFRETRISIPRLHKETEARQRETNDTDTRFFATLHRDDYRYIGLASTSESVTTGVGSLVSSTTVDNHISSRLLPPIRGVGDEWLMLSALLGQHLSRSIILGREELKR